MTSTSRLHNFAMKSYTYGGLKAICKYGIGARLGEFPICAENPALHSRQFQNVGVCRRGVIRTHRWSPKINFIRYGQTISQSGFIMRTETRREWNLDNRLKGESRGLF